MLCRYDTYALKCQDIFSVHGFPVGLVQCENNLLGFPKARGLEHFGEGLSHVFRHYAAALKPGAPFVFTYHHNDPYAYLPIVVAVLDAQLECLAT